MNIAEKSIRFVDGVQQRNRVAGFVFGVVKKFGDDRGPQLAALLTYYGFVSLFPLLLIFTTVLGFVGNKRLSSSVLGTTLSQFPVIGQQIGEGAAHPLKGSGLGLAIGLVLLLYGTLGFAQTAQHVMAQVWNVPGVARPGFLPRLGRSLTFFAVLGLGMVIATVVSGFATGHGDRGLWRILALAASVIVNTGLYFVVFRVLTPKSISARCLVPGSVVGGVGYTILLAVGTALVQHQLRNAHAVYGQFAFVLGLLGWIFFVAQLTVYGAEVNVVFTRRLWPRSIVQPPLTEADEQVLTAIAHQERRRPEEQLQVGFEAPETADAPAASGARDQPGAPERRGSGGSGI